MPWRVWELVPYSGAEFLVAAEEFLLPEEEVLPVLVEDVVLRFWLEVVVLLFWVELEAFRFWVELEVLLFWVELEALLFWVEFEVLLLWVELEVLLFWVELEVLRLWVADLESLPELLWAEVPEELLCRDVVEVLRVAAPEVFLDCAPELFPEEETVPEELRDEVEELLVVVLLEDSEEDLVWALAPVPAEIIAIAMKAANENLIMFFITIVR
ncbi:MAG: hypothetical protein ACI399_02235 [Candidatus Cryptobacteroides sp.]